MKISDIIREIYKENKKIIRLYLGLFAFLSVFLCGTGVFASESALAEFNIGGAFTNGLNSTLVFLFPQIEPCIGFGITTILAILGDYSLLPGNMSGLDFGLLGYSWIFRIIILVWCVLSILPRYFGVTRIGGLCIERINDKYVGTVVIILNVFPRLLSNPAAASAMAADTSMFSSVQMAGGALSGIIYSVTTFLGLCLMLAMYYVIRLFMMFIDIMILPVNCLIPGTSLVVETIKMLLCIFMAVNAIFSPVVFIIFYSIILILSLVFFKRAYTAVRYFKNIYMVPFWHKLTGKQSEVTLLPDKLPKKLSKYLEGRPYKAIIPVYVLRRTTDLVQVEKYEQMWMIVGYNYEVTLCKPIKDNVLEITVVGTGENKVFINNSLLYIEVFSVWNEKNIGNMFKNKQKSYQYVISKDYLPAYQFLQQQTGFWDYTQYANSIKPDNGARKIFGNWI